MTILIDQQGTRLTDRKSSLRLVDPIRSLGEEVEVGIWSGDFSFVGWDWGWKPVGIGGEYKLFGEFLTALADGRLKGTQLPKLWSTYSVRYLLVEGWWRVSAAGILETGHFENGGVSWKPAQGRGPQGWTAQEFFKQIGRLEHAFDLRVHFSKDLNHSARWIVAKYREWQSPPEQSATLQAWDNSGPAVSGSLLEATSDLPVVFKWAKAIPGVGGAKATWAALHFKTPVALAVASVDQWRQVGWKEQLEGGGTRVKHFSEDGARRIVDHITMTYDEVKAKYGNGNSGNRKGIKR